MPEFCPRDVVMVELTKINTGESKKVMVSSAYLAHEKEGGGLLLPESMKRLVGISQKKGLSLIMKCDASVHYAICGSINTNNRSRRLLKYLVIPDLKILSKENKPIVPDCTEM